MSDYGYNKRRRRDRDYGYERSPRETSKRIAADGSSVYCCGICTRIEVSSYEWWVCHLATREHQENMRRFRVPKLWNDRLDFRGKCVVIRGIEGKKCAEVGEYLKQWGEVEDFHYEFIQGDDGRARNCLCLFRDRESAEACRKANGTEWDGKKLEVSYYLEPYSSQGSPERKRRLPIKPAEPRLYDFC